LAADEASTGAPLAAQKDALGGRNVYVYDSRVADDAPLRAAPYALYVWDDYAALPSLKAADAELIMLHFHSIDGVCFEVERQVSRTGLSLEQVCKESHMRKALDLAMSTHVRAAFGLTEAQVEDKLTVKHGPLRVELSAKGWSAQQRAAVEAASAWCFASLRGFAHMDVHPNFRTVRLQALHCAHPPLTISSPPTAN
jgi:hypothetical protein